MQLPHPTDYQVVELRRYLIRDGECGHFAAHFDSYFPEAFEQLGAIAFGQFLERGSERFTWLRGFRDMDARAVVNAAFYYGPVWKQHKATLNGLMLDSDDVLLLHPLRDGDGVAVLPTLDAVAEAGGARGMAVAQLFALAGKDIEAFAEQARPTFDAYRASGARPAGLLATLDAPNNFPQLPVRTDGHWLVWLGLVEDAAMLGRWQTVQQHALPALQATGLLRAAPETLVLDPTRRSRLRWLHAP
ncbi:MAG TPA: NIPSNAP family protein [Rhodanobacteraceae bacterium]|jgi:hypothetical protein|nr:NIPSNAP family protein [Rhodanobacteraceae bacterium]